METSRVQIPPPPTFELSKKNCIFAAQHSTFLVFCMLSACCSFDLYEMPWHLSYIFIFMQTDEKYRCSETGYRIPLKCVEIKDNSKNRNGNGKGKSSRNSRSTLEISHGNEILLAESLDAGELTTSMKHRSLLEDPSTPESGPQAYITYRSCLPPVNEEKMSVLEFEVCVIIFYHPSFLVVFY